MGSHEAKGNGGQHMRRGNIKTIPNIMWSTIRFGVQVLSISSRVGRFLHNLSLIHRFRRLFPPSSPCSINRRGVDLIRGENQALRNNKGVQRTVEGTKNLPCPCLEITIVEKHRASPRPLLRRLLKTDQLLQSHSIALVRLLW